MPANAYTHFQDLLIKQPKCLRICSFYRRRSQLHYRTKLRTSPPLHSDGQCHVTYMSVDKIMGFTRGQNSDRFFTNRFRRRVYPQKTCRLLLLNLTEKAPFTICSQNPQSVKLLYHVTVQLQVVKSMTRFLALSKRHREEASLCFKCDFIRRFAAGTLCLPDHFCQKSRNYRLQASILMLLNAFGISICRIFRM